MTWWSKPRMPDRRGAEVQGLTEVPPPGRPSSCGQHAQHMTVREHQHVAGLRMQLRDHPIRRGKSCRSPIRRRGSRRGTNPNPATAFADLGRPQTFVFAVVPFEEIGVELEAARTRRVPRSASRLSGLLRIRVNRNAAEPRTDLRRVRFALRGQRDVRSAGMTAVQRPFRFAVPGQINDEAACSFTVLLPDRHKFLERVDGEAASLECGKAMRAARLHRHGHADLADAEPADAVNQGHIAERPAAAGLGLRSRRASSPPSARTRFVIEELGDLVARRCRGRCRERAQPPRSAASARTSVSVSNSRWVRREPHHAVILQPSACAAVAGRDREQADAEDEHHEDQQPDKQRDRHCRWTGDDAQNPTGVRVSSSPRRSIPPFAHFPADRPRPSTQTNGPSRWTKAIATMPRIRTVCRRCGSLRRRGRRSCFIDIVVVIVAAAWQSLGEGRSR